MIIVTGGAGFVGSNLVAELESRGLGPIIVSDRLRSSGKWKNIAKRQIFDIVPPEALASVLATYKGHVRAIFHLGAISDTTCTDGDAILANNVRLSFDLWDWCCENAVPFIYASSAATYGDGTHGFHDDDSPAGLAALRPLNLYGWSKHMVDRKFAAIAHAGGPTPPIWAGFKLFNVYGPNEYHKGHMSSVVPQLFRQIAQGQRARLFKSNHLDYEDGGQRRDFVWVGDVVDAMLWQLESGRESGIFNLGTGTARSFGDLARAVYAALDRPAEIEFVEMPPHLKDCYQYFTQADIGRLRSGGWTRDVTSLERGVRTYVENYLTADDPHR